jgi:hypothetical protein
VRAKILIAFSIMSFILWSSSCRKDFEYASSDGNLSFSKDTVYLDTVFANIGSSTYTLKVYNQTRDDVLIPNISLKNGPNSFYRLNVDGVAGKQFSNIPIYAQDSLFILIETTIAITDGSRNEFLYTDAIQFDSAPFQQEVELVTLAKDAIFFYPKTDTEGMLKSVVLETDQAGNQIKGIGFEFRDEELNFTDDKAYVIYGYGVVPDGKELQIDAGARVFFHKDSGIFIENGASISVSGKLSQDAELLEGEVIFEGDRLEPEFADIPGQWGGLWIAKGSTDNYLEYLTLRNAVIGLFAEGTATNSMETLTIKNSQIYNSLRHNSWFKNANVISENLVLGGAGGASLRCENGGTYSFTHCTVANYWNKGFRTRPALEISNGTSSDEIGFDLIKADFVNCIIDGNNQSEISLKPNELDLFNFSFQNCFIKYNQTNSNISGLYNFDESDSYENIILNGFTDFFLPTKNDFEIGPESDVIDKGELNAASTVPLDLSGIQRTIAPDLGVYQAKERRE